MTDEQHKLKERFQDEVKPYGFTLWGFSGLGKCFTFHDDDMIQLQICESEEKYEAQLSFACGLFTVQSGWFSWPHPRFEKLFLSKVRQLKMTLKEN